MPAGRKPKLNWTQFLGQYTTTIEGKFHRLGTDKAEAEKQFRFLQVKHDMDEPVTSSPTFGEVADAWLDHVQQTYDPERYRRCKARINEFLAYLGKDIKVRDMRPRHVENWIKRKAWRKNRWHTSPVQGDDPGSPELGGIGPGCG